MKDLLIESAIESGISQVNSLEYNNCLVTEKKQEEEIAVYPESGKAGLVFNSYGLWHKI
jgi:hypothetical protein